MSKNTIFVFNLRKEAAEQVLFKQDWVEKAKLRAGTNVCMILGPRGYKVLVEPSPKQEEGIPCKVMNIAEDQVILRNEPGQPEIEAWYVHLALKADSCSFH